MANAASQPERILIVRISALGDIVFCTSMLDGLRAAFPTAHIAWLAQPGFAGILEGDARIDQIVRLPAGGLEGPRGLLATVRLLRTLQPYDWIIDAQGLAKTRLLARLVRGRMRIGFSSSEPGEKLIDRLYAKDGDIADISSEYRYLTRQLVGTDPGPPRIQAGEAGRDATRRLMDSLGLLPGFVALCPFTTRPQKHWMPAYWGDLARRLAEAGHGPFVLLGGPGDRAAADRIFPTLPAGSVDLVGKTRLPELPALLGHARVVIGVDTGLTHIGIAVRRPVVALFGSTRPYTRGSDAPLRVLYDVMPCAPCKRRPTCNGMFNCMRGLTPPRVAAATLELLRRA